MSKDYSAAFATLAGLPAGAEAHPWQLELAGRAACGNLQIRIPTGFGKTYGVLGAWLWQRVLRGSEQWPRRLVWCLPMRVLVEQVAQDVRQALQRLGGAAAEIGVHALQGGSEAGDWHLHPERAAILIGTQDMLLSRALNRGYGAPRARWPMDFGLLNSDCLWVMDEVQLMDVGLATSTQLQSFREQDMRDGRIWRECRTWWMSATLQSSWLRSGPDAEEALADLPVVSIAPPQRSGPLWDADKVSKPLTLTAGVGAKSLASLVAHWHNVEGNGRNGPTLVVVNRVDTAVQIFRQLQAMSSRQLHGVDLRLVHSRFRPAERVRWREAFLQRAACTPGTNRIIVATQVIEAGVDLSAGLLVTEIAPWPSLVQRFGRCARWGGTGPVVVFDTAPKDDKAAAPYTKAAIDASRHALGHLADVAPLFLEAFEEEQPHLLPQLYPFAPAQLLLRHELDELFDTAADLSGADTDISRFIRSGDERDLQVFWREVDALSPVPNTIGQPARDELCAVPFLAARKWLCPTDKAARSAWVWDWLDGAWQRAEPRRLYPGQIVLVDSRFGGYDPLVGWSGVASGAVVPVSCADPGDDSAADRADATESDESSSQAHGWQSIAFHGAQVGARGRALAEVLVPHLAALFSLAGRWHDAGKAHGAFQACLKPHGMGFDVAKAPSSAWQPVQRLYRMSDGQVRLGFRHELASTLALLALMHRCESDHPGLLGPWRTLLSMLPAQAPALQPRAAGSEQVASHAPTNSLEQEIIALSADEFDLLLYLVCSHHGKVRMSWHASPADQAAQDSCLRIRGVRAGDVLPALELADATGRRHGLLPLELRLDAAAVGLNPYCGRGWTERVLGLLQRHGPFALAWLEALIRAADQQATRDSGLADPAMGRRVSVEEGSQA